MIFVVGLMFVGLLAIVLVLMLAFRTWSLDDAKTEHWIHSPETHSVAYVVPEGVDPAPLMAALTHAGFTTMTDTAGGDERLLVACEEQDRARVREIIEGAERKSLAELGLQVPPVAFDDER